MQRINFLPALVAILFFAGCIKAYDPVIDSSAGNKYVVSGKITNIEGWQEVEVSLSSPISSPKFIPVEGCYVAVSDDKGNQFQLTAVDPGHYRVWMRQADLVPGNAYRVKVVTRDNIILESDYDTMPRGPSLDSVYYGITEVPTNNPQVNNKVMQFYVDLNAVGNYSPYYKWDIVETWEYHAMLPAQYYYDGDIHEIIPPDSSNMVCWRTQPVRNVFTLSTKSLQQNSYKKFPLHNIDGKTSRLKYMYSMMVYQHALSEGAYTYWERLRVNSNEQGGLYEKQPFAIKGNVKNITDPTHDVLGCFYTTSESSRRYFYKDVEGITLDFFNGCAPYERGRFGWREIYAWEYPVYFYYNELGQIRLLNRECIDCRFLGGTKVKPDFWP